MGTFILAWLAFNWKPIIFIISSDERIKAKIEYVDENYASINNLLYYPLISVIVYLLVIPYINILFEICVKYAKDKKNSITISNKKQLISNEKDLAIEIIKLEEAKEEFKERKNINSLIENLEGEINIKEEQLQEERKRHEKLIEKVNEESVFIKKRHQKDLADYSEKIEELQKENLKLIDRVREYEQLLNPKKQNPKGTRIFKDQNGLYRISPNTNDKVYLTDSEVQEYLSKF